MADADVPLAPGPVRRYWFLGSIFSYPLIAGEMSGVQNMLKKTYQHAVGSPKFK